MNVLFVALAIVLCGLPAWSEISILSSEAKLRFSLDQNPANDIARERLTVLLLGSDRRDAAAYHAQHLARKANDPRLRHDASELLKRLDGPRWGWRPILAFAPSTNINKGSTQEIVVIGDTPFTIDADSRAVDGTGLTLGVAAWRGWRSSENWRARLSGEASAIIYDTSQIEAKQSLKGQLSFSRRFKEKSLSFGASIDTLIENGQLERRRLGPFLSGAWRIGNSQNLSARMELLDVHYPQERFRSGPTAKLSFGWGKRLSPTLNLHVGLPLESVRTGRNHLDYNKYGVTSRFDKVWRERIQTSLGFGIHKSHFRGDFPGTTTAREDSVSTVFVELSNNNWRLKGFTPTFRYEYTKSNSNVSLYEYDSSDIQFSFRKAF